MRRSEDFYPVRRERGDMIRSPEDFFGQSPWQAMRRMQEDLDRLFGGFFAQDIGMEPARGGRAMQQWAPSVDVSETDKEWCVEADLPGVRKDDINVELRDNQLTISAEMREELEQGQPAGQQGQQQGTQGQQRAQGQSPQEQGRQYHARERRYGRFVRAMTLPENVNPDQISCDVRDGVLTLHIPKAEDQRRQPRRIPVNAAEARERVETLPSETAAGRTRSEQEMEMTEEDEEPMAAGRGGQGSASGR